MDDKNIKEINKATDLISSLIHEYLYKKDYLKTLDAFQKELSEKIKSGKYYTLLNYTNPSYNTESLLKYFELGDKTKFMEQWKRIIPNNLKLIEPTLFKLDFNIEIYFSIYPILKTNPNYDIKAQKDLKKNMEEFKLYLEQNNTEQFKTPEFLAYYALPFIPDPRNNSVYAHLFEPVWSKCLKEQIQKCLDYYSPNNYNKFPILYELTSGKKIISLNYNDLNKKESNIKNNLKNIYYKNEEKRIKELIKANKILNEENTNLRLKDTKNKQVFLDAQKTWCSLALDIISYSFDLLDIYNKITNNQKNNTINEINNKLLKYQSFLFKNYEELENNNNKNLNEINNILNSKKLDIQDSKFIENNNNKYNFNYSPNKILNKENSNINNTNINNNNMSINNNILNNKLQNLFDSSNIKIRKEKKNDLKIENNSNVYNNLNNIIDMRKFIQALNNEIYIEDEKLIHIFQEIRFRIFNKENKNLQELTLYEIFYYDLFGTLSKDSKIFKRLLSNKNLNLEVMKLVNSLANFNKGKNYLLSKNSLIEDIVKCMISEKNDSELRQNCLGTIQKFTLRNEPQNKLIELNVIHYLVDIFSYQCESLSDYTIEYGLALLMNLSLRKEGKEKFEAVGDKIINIIIKFLNYENIQILTCINGILYSLLKKKKIRELAKDYEIEQKLNELKKFNNQQLNKQIKYIIDELNNYSDNNDCNADSKDELFTEEDINTKDNLDSIFNEYPENKILDKKYYEEHNKILSEFIITDNELELIEKQKIINFMNEDINMTKGLLVNNNRSNDSSFRKEDDIINNNIKIDNEEIIIKTNINEDNNGEYNNYINNNEGVNYNYDALNPNNDFDDIFGRPDDGFAFKSKDKIKRTPPRTKI